MNYREAWANGEIEAGTLVDAIEDQAREIERLNYRYQREVYGLNNEGDPIGGDPAGGYANDNARLRKELAALKAQPVGVVLPDRASDEITDPAGYDEGWNACLDEVSSLNPAPSHGEQVRDGWKLVPERMHLSREAIESITAHCGDGQEDAGYGPYSDGVLWVGEIEEEDGAKTYGLHIATTDYPEEGSTTLVEFAAPSAASQKGGE